MKKKLTHLITNTKATAFTCAALEPQKNRLRASAHSTSENYHLLEDPKYHLEIKLQKIKLIHRGKRTRAGRSGGGDGN